MHVEHPRVRDRADVRVMGCDGCGLVFLDRVDHVAGDFYERSGMYGHAAPDLAAIAVDGEEDTRRRVELLRWLAYGKAYLDFGSGQGLVAQEMAKIAASTRAVELHPVMREHLAKLGIESAPSLDALTGTYDVISLFHVLEHLEDPIAVLKRLGSFLKPKGTIVVEVPSSDDALITLYGSKAFRDFTYWSPHLYLFNPGTLRTVARRAGLEVELLEQVQRYPLANHLHWLSHGKPGGHRVWDFLRDTGLDRAYAAKLAERGLCDTLVVRMRLPD